MLLKKGFLICMQTVVQDGQKYRRVAVALANYLPVTQRRKKDR